MTESVLETFLVKDSFTVLQAMEQLDKNGARIAIVVDQAEKLLGILTDGDLRRFLLKGGRLDANILLAANLKPKCATTVEKAEVLIKDKKYVAIPIIREDKTVVGLFFNDQAIEDLPQLKIPVVINAGGKGTRLDPYTRILPKPLIPVGEKPIIEHIMQRFQKYGCNQFHIIVNYKKEIMKGYFSECEGKYNITWHDEYKPLGTGGGLSLLKGKIVETFFFSNCDNLLLSSYDSILRFHKSHHNVITMVCAYKNFQIPYGVVEMGLDGEIMDMKEKPELSYLTNTGIYVVEPEVLDDIPDDINIDFPDIVKGQQNKGKKVAAFPVRENDWLDMGQINGLENMRKRLCGE